MVEIRDVLRRRYPETGDSHLLFFFLGKKFPLSTLVNATGYKIMKEGYKSYVRRNYASSFGRTTKKVFFNLARIVYNILFLSATSHLFFHYRDPFSGTKGRYSMI